MKVCVMDAGTSMRTFDLHGRLITEHRWF